MRKTSSLVAFILAMAFSANAQQVDDNKVVDHILHSGDGLSAGTAYAVPSLLWEYLILGRLHLRFDQQRTSKATGTDVITAHDAKSGHMQEVWFRAGIPDAADQAEGDRLFRPIVTSGDGLSPETAFVVAGNIDAEYRIARFMGIKINQQALMTIRGCSFDRLAGRELDTDKPRNIYFKLGSPDFDYRGECVLRPRQ